MFFRRLSNFLSLFFGVLSLSMIITSLKQVLSCTKDAGVGVKDLNRHLINISIFSGLCRCRIQQRGLVVSLWRTYSLGSSLGYLGIPMGTFWPTTQFNVTQSQYQKLHLVRGVHSGLYPPPIIY